MGLRDKVGRLRTYMAQSTRSQCCSYSLACDADARTSGQPRVFACRATSPSLFKARDRRSPASTNWKALTILQDSSERGRNVVTGPMQMSHRLIMIGHVKDYVPERPRQPLRDSRTILFLNGQARLRATC